MTGTVPPSADDSSIDDPWKPVLGARGGAAPTRVAATEDIGDTSALVRSAETAESAGQGMSTEIVDLLTQSLAEHPERGDLWLMRFEMYRTLGMKAEFAEAMQQAWDQPRVRAQLDWTSIKQLWDAVSRGAQLPEGIELSQGAAPAAPQPVAVTELPPGYRRFADVATSVAGDALAALAQAYADLRSKPGFYETFVRSTAPMLKRPTPLYHAERLSLDSGAQARIFFKREDLRRLAPELGNAAAQLYIAKALGRTGVVSANDVDAHADALAMLAPTFGLTCTVFVRPADLQGKAELVAHMRQLGATVEASGDRALITADPREAALHFWRQRAQECHLALSLGTGPPPYPTMVSDFQSLLGRETELQLRALAATGRRRCLVAAMRSVAESIGFMLPQLARNEIMLFYAEPDRGSDVVERPDPRMEAYGGMRREHAALRASGRIRYITISDVQAKQMQHQVSTLESIGVSLEDARAVAVASVLARKSSVPCDVVTLVA